MICINLNIEKCKHLHDEQTLFFVILKKEKRKLQQITKLLRNKTYHDFIFEISIGICFTPRQHCLRFSN